MAPPTDTWIVVPCFNEAARLRPELFDVYLDGRSSSVGFLFVDDGSTDGTTDILHRLCDDHPSRLRMLTLESNHGKAEAVRQGFLTVFPSRPRYVGYWDADLSAPLAEVDSLRSVFGRRPDIDVVLGVRLPLLGHRIQHGRVRQQLGRLFAVAASVTLGHRFHDTQCGAKLFRVTPVLCAAVDMPFQSRWIFDIELLLRCTSSSHSRRRSFDALLEYPLETWVGHGHSKVKPWYYVWAGVELLGIYVRDRMSSAGLRKTPPVSRGSKDATTEEGAAR